MSKLTLIIIAGFLGLSVCGGAMSLIGSAFSGGGGPLAGPLWPTSGPCSLADLNGDGVGEIGVLLHYGSYEHQQVAVLDGASGDVIREGAPTRSAETGLLCASPSQLVVKPGPEFRVDVYRAADGTVQQLGLPDQAFAWARGDGCFVVHTSDGSTPGFRLGEAVVRGPCEATEDDRAVWEHDSYTQDRDETVAVSFEDDQYSLTFRKRGTELVRVSHESGWTRELSAVGVPHSGRGGIVAVPGGAIVFAGRFPENEEVDTAIVMRLAAESGETTWQHIVSHHLTVNFGGAVYNGRYVVAVIGNRMIAFDPAQGDVAWDHGA